MGIYYFAVDYSKKQQIWAPDNYTNKAPGVFSPNHPLPNMVFMKNCQGYNFEVVSDSDTYHEHEFDDITESVFKELKTQFPNYKFK